MRYFALLNSGEFVLIPNVDNLHDAFESEPAETIWVCGEDSMKVMLASAAKSMGETQPRVLITVFGGVADYVSDPGVDVEIFDHDNHDSQDEDAEKVPAHFADLAEPIDVPFEGQV